MLIFAKYPGRFEKTEVVSQARGGHSAQKDLIHGSISDTIKCITSCESEIANLSGSVKTVLMKQSGSEQSVIIIGCGLDSNMVGFESKMVE